MREDKDDPGYQADDLDDDGMMEDPGASIQRRRKTPWMPAISRGELADPFATGQTTHTPKANKIFLWGKWEFLIEGQKREAHFRYTNVFSPSYPTPPSPRPVGQTPSTNPTSATVE